MSESPDRGRVSPDKAVIAILVYTMACLQVLALALKAWQGQSELGFWFNAQWPTLAVGLTHKVYFALMALALIWTFFRWSPWPFIGLGLLFLAEECARMFNQGLPRLSLSLPANAVLYVWFFALGLALKEARTLDIELGFPKIRQLLRLALALSLATLGLEALAQGTIYADPSVLKQYPYFQWIEFRGLAAQGFVLVGVIDLIAALWLVLRADRTLMSLLIVWGAIKAFAMVGLLGWAGFWQGAMLAPYIILPLLILRLEGQRSLRHELRRSSARLWRRYSPRRGA